MHEGKALCAVLLALGFSSVRAQEIHPEFRIVRYYDPRGYDGADVPFAVSPPEIYFRQSISERTIESVVRRKGVVIEVCTPMKGRNASDPLRWPVLREERERYCVRYRRQ